MKTLLFMFSDFSDSAAFFERELPEEEMTEEEGKDFEWPCDDPDVEPLGGNLFRVLEPTSLTFFGPYGPGLTMGQIIEAEPISTGVWRYARTRSKPAVRSWLFRSIQRDVLNEPDILQDLQLLHELDCGWEYCVGNITIQTELMKGDPLLSEVERTVDRVSQKIKSRAQELWQRHARIR